MRAFSLMYHDVTLPGQDGESGMEGAGAAVYKIEREEFGRHLDAIAALGAERVKRCIDEGKAPRNGVVYLTFDDGGVSARWIGEELERRGWRGHFFLTTDWIGRRGFVTEEDVRVLVRRGHVIGSHSCSHPRRMSVLPRQEIEREWRESVAVLGGLAGKQVTVASVPGGFYSRQVGEAAARAGIRQLFTSEPATKVTQWGECRLYGRYSIQRGMGAEMAAAFAGGAAGPRWRQAVTWKVKKVAKAVGGDMYLKLRKSYWEQRAK